MFWSDLGPKITFEAIGIIDSTLPTVAIYAKSADDDSSKNAQDKDEKNVCVKAPIYIYIFFWIPDSS